MARSEHLVHLFDDDRSRIDTVSTFLAASLTRNGHALVVALPDRWARIASAVDERGAPSDRLTFLDAHDILSAIQRDREIKPELFDAVVRPIVAALAADSAAPLTAYGEIVDILASEGDFKAVDALEACWNTLLADEPVTLLCGYSSAHFAVQHRHCLAGVCSAHARVFTGGDDSLSGWLFRMSS